MQFVVQMGLIEKINCNEYMIKSDIDISYRQLKDSQKNTLSALYDLFGEDAFFVDMVIANLEYSSSHISGILHQFTWLRLLDCTTNVDNTHCYQLNVNPVDNPECFGIVA